MDMNNKLISGLIKNIEILNSHDDKNLIVIGQLVNQFEKNKQLFNDYKDILIYLHRFIIKECSFEYWNGKKITIDYICDIIDSIESLKYKNEIKNMISILNENNLRCV